MRISKATVVLACVFFTAAPRARTQTSPAPAGQGGPAVNRGRGQVPRADAYPQHNQADPAAIERGKQVFSVNCSFCHGTDARGGEGGPNLLRSQSVIDDQNGETVGVVLLNGRVDRGMPKFDFPAATVSDIAGFLHSLYVSGHDPSRDLPANILVGDAKAGETYFNGKGKCVSCHSSTGDLARIGAKYDPKTLQDAIVSGGGGGRGGRGASPSAKIPPTTVKVTLPSGEVAEGTLAHIDEFDVSLTSPNGDYRTFSREGNIPKVEVQNPLQGHLDLIRTYTDDEIHNLTAYLVTLK